MVTSLFLPLIVSATTVAPVEAKVVSASLFKNGYAVLVREAPLADGETLLSNIPQAALGTLWITASKGAKLQEVVGTTTTTKVTADAKSLDEVIAANVGKRVRLQMGTKEVVGKILSANGGIVVVESPQGVSAFPKGSVTSITAGSELVWKVTNTVSSRAFRIRANAPAGAKLYVLSLERGLTWAPAYAADITGKEMDFTAKATVMNDLADLEGIDVRLITGFPNIPFIGVLDPFTLANNVDQFTSALMGMGAPSQFGNAPGAMMQQNVGRARMAESFSSAFDTSGMAGVQNEDLFFYSLPKVRLKKGDRGYFVLFNFQAPYEHLYEVSVPDEVQNDVYRPQPVEQPLDVWHSLKFKNASKQPMTTAAAITTKEGEILGQDMINYTSAGSDVSLKITKALDLQTEAVEEEIQRTRKTLNWGGNPNYPFDEVTLKGMISIRNGKSSPVSVKVTKYLSGDLTQYQGQPKITKLAKGLRAINPRVQVVWDVEVAPGERLELPYEYKVLFRG